MPVIGNITSSKPAAPDSVTTLTSGSYTVPVGKVARVSALCNGSAIISINSVQVLNGSAWNAMSVNASPRTIRMNSSGFKSLSIPIAVDSVMSLVTPNKSGNGITPGNTAGGSWTDDGDAFTNGSATDSITAQYVLPAGTIISTTNGRCLIEIYSL